MTRSQKNSVEDGIVWQNQQFELAVSAIKAAMSRTAVPVTDAIMDAVFDNAELVSQLKRIGLI